MKGPHAWKGIGIRLSGQPWLMAFALTTLVIALVIGTRMSGLLQYLELSAYDQSLRLRAQTSQESRVVLVEVTEADIDRLGWPLADGLLARLLEQLLALDPRVVGVDLYRDRPVGEGGALLDEVLARDERVIGVWKFGRPDGEDGVDVAPALAGTGRMGFSDIVIDSDGTVRRGLLYLDDGVEIFTSFGLALSLAWLRHEGIHPRPDPDRPGDLRLGDTTLTPMEPNDGAYVRADTRGYQILMDFSGVPFPTVSAGEVLDGNLPPDRFRDAVVIVGVVAESVKDYFHSPFSGGGETEGRVSGIQVHAHLVNQLLNAGTRGIGPVRVLDDGWEHLWIGVWSLAGGLLGLWAGSALRLSFWSAAGVLVLAVATWFAIANRLWLPVVPPMLGWLASMVLVTAWVTNREKVQRAQLMQIFSRYIARDVAESLWAQRAAFLEGGRPRPQKLTATVLFSDIKGFTPVSEKLDPRGLMEWLNEYMEIMSGLVANHGGVVDKFIGDAVMAVFGVPVARGDEAAIREDAVHAVECALEMEAALSRLNARWRSHGLPAIGIRVGIYTGPLVAGSLGSADRLEYTVVGDTVNIASRLESFEKSAGSVPAVPGPVRILIGESTARYVGGRYHSTRVGSVCLKGKEAPVTVYLVTGRAGDGEERIRVNAMSHPADSGLETGSSLEARR